ncbi:MAG: hypothetical protein K8S15_10955 [Candidatus Aegiribacteria sp.]|nr:hypothetical protein [Candidatus Aegiribacteria sp.]
MIRTVLLICALILFAHPLYADHAFIWNYDDDDVFYCSEYGGSIDCSYWIEQTLTCNGHTFTTNTALPSDLSSYDVVFVLTGWYRC